jgi:hypothetical protein
MPTSVTLALFFLTAGSFVCMVVAGLLSIPH